MRSLFRNLGSLLQSFLQARQGNVVIFAALALIPMVELVGAAIDYSRANLVRVNIQAALDSTALMLANDTAVPSMSQSQLQTKATNVFTALFDPVYAQNVSVTPTYSAGQPPKVTMSATATVPTVFARVLGIQNIPLTMSVEATKGISVELALVLDNTGSMVCGDSGFTTGLCTTGTSHITSLITAANQIVTTLFSKAAGSNGLKMAVVPYVTTVNPGPKITPYVNMTDVNGNSLYDPSGNTPTYDNTSENTREWKGCVVESTAMVNNGQDVQEPTGGWTGPWRAYYWPSAGTPSNPNQSTSSPSHGYSGIPDYNSWMSGNVGSNPTVNISYAHSGDLSSQCFINSHGPNNGCPTQVTELTNDQTTLHNAINALKPWCASGTMSHIGMLWGWRALSPNPPFSDGKPYDTHGLMKVVVLETDGENELVPDCDAPGMWGTCSNNSMGSNFPTGPQIAPQTQLTGEGRVPDGLLGTTTSINTAKTTMGTRLATLCTNMKAAGIIIYTIGFGPAATNGANAATLQACAGPNPGQYFSAPNAAALQTAFQSIANSLNLSHLSK